MNTKKIKNNIEEKINIDSENENTKSKKNNKSKYQIIISIILFDILYLYIIFFISNIGNDSFLNGHDNLINKDNQIPILIYEILTVSGFALLFKAIFKKSLRKNIALTILFQIISIISFYKVQVVEKPFWPEDILLIGSATDIAKFGNIKLELMIEIQIILSIAILVIQKMITSKTNYEEYFKDSKKIRISKFILSMIILISICGFNWASLIKPEALPIAEYAKLGAVADFFSNMYKLGPKKTLDIYTEKAVENIKEEVEKESSANTDNNINSSKIQPNIITIMVESLSDPMKMEGVNVSKDPLPTYRELSKNYASGNVITDIYGGETSMSEFEFLSVTTSKNLLNDEKYPYTQIVNKNTNSIVKVLKDNGYYTTAIHANEPTFYNRENAYKNLGFDKTVFEDDFKNIEKYINDNTSDLDTIKEIINQYETIEEEKKFIFAVTIESHMPYLEDKYEEHDITITSDKVAGQMKYFSSYAQGVYNFDNALKYLVNYFEKIKEPVMVVVYGDHLPPLNEIYNEFYGENIERYETPYVVWANYDIKDKKDEDLSVAALSMKVLKEANIELPWYYKFMGKFYEKYSIYTKRFIIDNDGVNYNLDTTNELIDKYRILQYNLMYKNTIK